MSDRTNGEIHVRQNSDIAVQLVWSDDQGAPVPCNTPARAEVRDALDALVLTFDDGANAATQAHITASPTSGVIQMTCPKALSATLQPGRYAIDVFATVTDAAPPFESGQYRPAFSGWFTVAKATTQGAP